MAIYARNVETALTVTFSYIGVPLFLVVAVVAFLRLVARHPAFLIDRTGVMDRSSLSASGLVRWDQIGSIAPYTDGG